MIDGERAGLATYAIEDGDGELVTLNALRRRLGIGAALVEAVRQAAEAAGCRRLWLITTNDNAAGQRFYEALGFRRVAAYQGAIDEYRRTLKPEIPVIGQGGVEIHDEIEFEIRLGHWPHRVTDDNKPS